MVNSKAIKEKVYSAARVGLPSTSKDEKLTLKNLCFVITANSVERLLINHDGKFRIPSDKELIMIYGNSKKKEDAVINIKGKEIDVYDPRWTTGGLKKKWEAKAGKKESKAKPKAKAKAITIEESAKATKPPKKKKKSKVTKESLKKELGEISKKLQDLD